MAIWPPAGREPIGAALRRADRSRSRAPGRGSPGRSRPTSARPTRRSDRLTGLANRRKFDELVTQAEPPAVPRGRARLRRPRPLQAPQRHAGPSRGGRGADPLRPDHPGADPRRATWPPGSGARSSRSGFPKAELEVGARIAERIRIKLGTTPWDWNGRPWPLSASFGVAACPETGRTLKALPAQADAALYVAKNSGRNRVERAGRSEDGRRKDGRRRGAGAATIASRLPPRRLPLPSSVHPLSAIFTPTGATGFDGFVEGMAACPGPESW